MPGLSATGWSFMVTGLCLIGVALVAPHAYRRAQQSLHHYHSPSLMVQGDVELRMMVGFILSELGVALYTGMSFVRGTMVEAGAFGDLYVFVQWSRWTLLGPSVILISMGNALILWDSYGSKRGWRASFILLVVALILWFLGMKFAVWLTPLWLPGPGP